MKRYFSFLLIVVILFNFIVVDLFQRNRVYSEFVVTSGLALKVFASVLAGMGVFLSTSDCYQSLYDVLSKTHLWQLNQYTSLAKNLLLHRIVVDVAGRYEFIRDFINELNFSAGYTDVVTIDTVGVDTVIDKKGLIYDGYSVTVSDNYVFSIGDTIFKSVATHSGYNIFSKSDEYSSYTITAGILNNTHELVFVESRVSSSSTFYEIYYRSDDDLISANGGVTVYNRYPNPTVDVDLAETIDIGILKETDIVDLPKTKIGVNFSDPYYNPSFDSVYDLVDYLDDINTFDDDYIDSFDWDYDIDKTDIVVPSIALERVPVRDVDTYPPIEGIIDSPIDIPLNPDIPFDPAIPIPDEIVLEENLIEDTNVFGLNLITRFLRFISNVIKLIPSTIISVGKSIVTSVKAIPSIIVDTGTSIVTSVKAIPSTVIDTGKSIVTSVKAISSTVIDTGKSIVTSVKAIPSTVIDTGTLIVTSVKAIPSTIVDTFENFKTWFANIFTSTISIDFSPLKVSIIKSKFPFCLPFDLVSIFNQLNTAGNAPVWKINLLSATFVLDFAIFEGLAVIVRWAITIIFVISLIKMYSIMFL